MIISKVVIFSLALFCGFASYANSLSILNKIKPSTVSHTVKSEQEELVNINTATEEVLTSVKGIGPKQAQAIIAYREEHGSFKSVDDLNQVKGIGKKKLEKIKVFLTV